MSDGHDFDMDSDGLGASMSWEMDAGDNDPRSGFDQDDASDGEAIYDPFEYEKMQELPEQELSEQDHYQLAQDSDDLESDPEQERRDRDVFIQDLKAAYERNNQ